MHAFTSSLELHLRSLIAISIDPTNLLDMFTHNLQHIIVFIIALSLHSLWQLWRLPALLVEDFSEINPDLLRSAYVEAVYRADEFEFQRLKQSYWWKVITDVSRSKSSQPLLDAFPIEGTNPGFTRPKVPFACAMTGQCGPGTKMTPKQSC